MNLDAAQLNETHPSRNIARHREAYREKKDAETQAQVLLIEQRRARSRSTAEGLESMRWERRDPRGISIPRSPLVTPGGGAEGHSGKTPRLEYQAAVLVDISRSSVPIDPPPSSSMFRSLSCRLFLLSSPLLPVSLSLFLFTYCPGNSFLSTLSDGHDCADVQRAV